MILNISKGVNLSISGQPEQRIMTKKNVGKVALIGPDYVGMRPTMKVQVGDTVSIGDPLFECKKTPGVLYTSIAAGRVTAVKRGEKRAFQTVEIEISEEKESHREFRSYKGVDPEELDREDIVRLMAESGLWPSLRTRPFSKTPALDSIPHSIFITAIDTNPLSVNPDIVISRHPKDFKSGVKVLMQLTKGNIHIVKTKTTQVHTHYKTRIQVHDFSGVHPAGNVGTHIHFIDPVSLNKCIWHLNYQDVIALGKLFTTGKLFLERIISLAGPEAVVPKIVSTRLGASLDELTADEVRHTNVRIISGSVFNGRQRDEPFCFLGRYHNQVTLLCENRRREFLGWLSLGFNKFSVKSIYMSKLFSRKRFPFTTSTNGSLRAMLPIGSYESIMPLDILPTQLLRALASEDTDTACDLGLLELDEEDLALCTFVSPSKIDYGYLLRKSLEQVEKER